jgi:hypothetical protein
MKNLFSKKITEEKLEEILKEMGLTLNGEEWLSAFSFLSAPPKYKNIGKRIDDLTRKMNMLIKYLDIEEKKHEAKEFFAKKAKPVAKKK